MIKAFFGDPHFGHHNILSYCDRPFRTIGEMNDCLINNYNRMINQEDIVFWTGDCFFKDTLDQYRYLLGKMHGRKILVIGNHDRSESVMAGMGFELVMREAAINIHGVQCRVNHYPYDGPKGKPDKYWSRRPKRNPGEILLHGHTHSMEKISSPTSINVGVDAWGYGPALYGEVAALVWKLANPNGS